MPVINAEKFENIIDEILFSGSYPDTLFKDGVKPYIKDAFRFKNAKKILKDPKEKTIYDIGPYPGTGVYYFGEHNKMVGLGKSDEDFSKKYDACGHSIVDIDFESDQMPQGLVNKADILLMMEIIEHIRQPLKFLKKVTALVKPGGLLYLTTNNFSYIGYILKLVAGQSILDPIKTEDTFYPGHCRYYLLNELSLVLEDHGYTIKHRKCINFLPNSSIYRNRLFGVAKNGLMKITPSKYSTHIEILAQKK